MHVSREFLIPLICSLAAFTFLFMLNNIFDDLPDFISSHVPWHLTALYFLALQPHNLVHVVPVAILLAASFMTAMLGRNNELCAMRAAGLSLAVCALPVWISAVVAAGATAAISESWGQSCTRYANELKATCTEHRKKDQPPLAASFPDLQRDWSLVPDQNEAFANVLIRQFDEHGNTLWILAAKQAVYAHHGVWRFSDGTRQHFDNANAPAQNEAFTTLELTFPERPADFQENTAALDAISTRQALAMLRRNPPPPPKNARRLQTIVYYNLTFPLASIVAALFGFSMTIANQRSGVMKGFAGAIGMLVLFYIVGQVLFVMGKNGWLPPLCAGALPNLAFTAAGIANVWRKQ